MKLLPNMTTSFTRTRSAAIHAGLGLALLFAVAAEAASEAVVVFNSRMPESKEVAEYYAQRRQVPKEQIFGLELPASEAMSRKEFLEQLQGPLLKKLEEAKLLVFSPATNKAPENGSEPSNIIDQGYPMGAINLSGQTPIILVNDGPSMGGFINPYTVPSAAFWKLGQSKPGDIYRFKSVTVDEAQVLRKKLNAICSPSSIM